MIPDPEDARRVLLVSARAHAAIAPAVIAADVAAAGAAARAHLADVERRLAGQRENVPVSTPRASTWPNIRNPANALVAFSSTPVVSTSSACTAKT